MDLVLADLQLPLRLRTSSPMSDDELLRFCAANELLQIEREPDGEILIMSPSGFGTSKINQRIGHLLYEWAEADGRGVVTGCDGGYTLPDGSMRAPDAAWFSTRRIDQLTAEEQARFAPLCPDFVIEIRSPSDKLERLKLKMEQWIGNGAELAWLIDPIDKTVAIYRPGQAPATLVDPSSVQGTGSMTGFELVLSRVWA